VSESEAPAWYWAPSADRSKLELRHRILRSIRSYFDAAGFVEVETPSVVRNPGLELHLDALEVVGCAGPRWLHTSPEYHMKRLLAAGMPSIYQVCKAFRRDERGALHQPEFTLLEWYRTPAGYADTMRDTEQLVAQLARELYGTTRIPGVSAEIDVAPPWERLSVHEAFERYAGVRVDALLPDEEAFYRTLIEQVEPRLGRGKPTFLTRYPASMASLAQLCPDDWSVAERFEAYVDGVELCNGFGELTDAAEQRRRCEADLATRWRVGKALYPIDELFLGALEHGLPPASGNALGVDRLVMLLAGVKNIAQVVAFSAERV
jgi:lysyl-tRNA synthetase class 2